jgi:sarcosine oxidase subunit delta
MKQPGGLSLPHQPESVHAERWLHAHGCQRWFNALRDTTSDRIIGTYAMGEPARSTQA